MKLVNTHEIKPEIEIAEKSFQDDTSSIYCPLNHPT